MAASIQLHDAGARPQWLFPVLLGIVGAVSLGGLVFTLRWAGLLSADLILGLPVAFCGMALAVFCVRFVRFIIRSTVGFVGPLGSREAATKLPATHH